MPQATLTLSGNEIEVVHYYLQLTRSQHQNDKRPIGIVTGCNLIIEAEAQHALLNFTSALLPPGSSDEISVDGTIVVESPNRGSGNIDKQIDFKGGHLVDLQESFREDGVQGEPMVKATFAVEELDIDGTNLLTVDFFI